MSKWPMARLYEVAPATESEQPLISDEVWLLNLDMVESVSGRIISKKLVKPEIIGSSTIRFDEDTVLYSKLRPYLNKVVLPESIGYATSEMIPLRPDKSRLSRRYLATFLRSPHFVNYISAKVSGTKMPRANIDDLRATLIPLPPIDEQNRITSTLDAVSEVLRLRKAQLAELDNLVKSQFVEMFGDPVSNSKQLPTKIGCEFFKLTNGRFVPQSKRFDIGIPAYGGNGISWYTDEILCKNDTIVVGRVGFQSGNVHLVNGPLWITDNAMYISDYRSDVYNLVFLCALMEHIDFTRFQDAGDLKKITQKPFMCMKFIHPPLSMQLEFAAFVDQVNESKVALQKAQDEAQLLFDSLMAEYFEE